MCDTPGHTYDFGSLAGDININEKAESMIVLWYPYTGIRA